MDILEDDLLQIYIDSGINKEFHLLTSKKSAFFILDKKGQVAYANRFCELLTGEQTMIGRKLSDIFPLSSLNQTQCFFKGKDAEALARFETVFEGNEGARMKVRFSYFPIYYNQRYLGTFFLMEEI